MSFAYLVYASAWLTRYHPAAFCAALLNAQPVGFYSRASGVINLNADWRQPLTVPGGSASRGFT
jgi:DNA polymerase III alpha subunit